MIARWQTLRRQPIARAGILVSLLVLLSLLALSGISSGAVEIQESTIRKAIADRIADRLHLGYQSDLDYSDRLIARDAALVLDSRLPRVLLAGLIGAGLGLAGASLQGVFRSPLVEPGLVGISSGSAAGAVTAILLGFQLNSSPGGERAAQSILAFIGALLVTLLVYRLVYWGGQTDSVALLLVGVALNAITSSYVGMATYLADQAEAGDITFWTLGSLANTFWRDVYLAAPFILGGLLILPFLAKPLNLIALGDSEARNLGVAVDRLRLFIMALAALMVGVSVAIGGIIAFVGLVVPHVIRFLFGPDHRLVLPASALGGAVLLIAADLFARIVAERTEVPIGVVTTMVGGPMFLFLVLSNRRGW